MELLNLAKSYAPEESRSLIENMKSKRNVIIVENHLKDIRATFTTSFNKYGHVVFEVYL